MAVPYEVSLTIGGLKVEHVGEVLRRLEDVLRSLESEGLDVQEMFSVMRDADGVERWHEWVNDDGTIRDVSFWDAGEGSGTPGREGGGED